MTAAQAHAAGITEEQIAQLKLDEVVRAFVSWATTAPCDDYEDA